MALHVTPGYFGIGVLLYGAVALVEDQEAKIFQVSQPTLEHVVPDHLRRREDQASRARPDALPVIGWRLAGQKGELIAWQPYHPLEARPVLQDERPRRGHNQHPRVPVVVERP